MARPEQQRPALGSKALQQLATMPAGAMPSRQVQFVTVDASFRADKDLAFCDASGGAIALTLPSVTDALVGKSYGVRETEGTNDVTLDTPGAERIDGNSTLVVPAGAYAEIVLVENPADAFMWHVVNDTRTNTLGAGSVGTTELADGAVTPVKENITPRANAAGTQAVLTTSDRNVTVESDGGGAQTIDASALLSGQSVKVSMRAFNTDAYTLAVVGGTLTLNAVGETALIYNDGTSLVAFLAGGATIV